MANDPGLAMRIEYLHASRYGNGAMVATEFRRQMVAKGASVQIHHIREVKPHELASADLYVFSSPGRLGRPTGAVRRFLNRVELPKGTRYAIVATELAPRPNREGRMPTAEELAKWQRVVPIMDEILEGKGLVKIAEGRIRVTGIKGPLEEGWQRKLEAVVSAIPVRLPAHAG